MHTHTDLNKFRIIEGQIFANINWRDCYPQENDLLKLFAALDIPELETLVITNRVRINEDREVLYLLSKLKGIEHSQKIYIDIISGTPSTEQFVDATYDSGADSDLKIIIFKNNIGDCEYDDIRQEAFIAFLAEKNNRCGVPTYLINAKKILDHEWNIEPIVRPVYSMSKHCRSLPSKKEVKIADFWAHYYEEALLNCGMASHVYEYDDSVLGEWSPSYGLGKNCSTVATWTDEGLFMSLIGNPGEEFIKWVWDHRDKYIEPHYPGCPVTLHGEAEKPHEISVRVLELSMTELLMMSAEDKYEYGEMIYGQEHRINDVMYDALDAYNKLNEIAAE